MTRALGLLALTALAGMIIRFQDPGAPEGIKVKAPTEQSIREEIKNEHRQLLLQRATRVAAQVYRRNGCGVAFAEITARVAIETGLSPRVLSALVFVESSCNPNAGFNQASVGLTQVNTRIWHYTKAELRDPERNLRVGASILASYVRRYGLAEGLHHYNGLGDSSDKYSKKVLDKAGLSV
jgi:hypothetical protein